MKTTGKLFFYLTTITILCFITLIYAHKAAAKNDEKTNDISEKNIKTISSDKSVKNEDAQNKTEPRQEQAENTQPEEVKKIIMIDLDGDGSEEKIDLKPYFSDDSGGYYKLCVSRKKGNEYINIWESPNVKGFGEDFSFYFGDAGLEPLETAGDIDGDSNIELISPQAQSDVSPAVFRIFRWNKRFFELNKRGLFIAARPTDDFFKFTNDYKMEGQGNATWIMHFTKVEKPGVIAAEIWSYQGGSVHIGEALMTYEPNGYKVSKWLKPLKKIE